MCKAVHVEKQQFEVGAQIDVFYIIDVFYLHSSSSFLFQSFTDYMKKTFFPVLYRLHEEILLLSCPS